MRTLRSGGFNYNADDVSRETGMKDNQEEYPSKTVQSGKDDADINVIVRRFKVTGQGPVVARIPRYGDYTGINDFQSAMNVLREAEEGFMALPSGVRNRFGNDPQAFLEFCADKNNFDELRKMGLAIPKVDDNITPEPNGSARGEDDAKRVGKRAGKAAKASGGSEGNSDGEQEGA